MNPWVRILPSSFALQMVSPGRGLCLKRCISESRGGRLVGGFGSLNEHPRMRILELRRRLVMWKVEEPCVVGGPGTARIEFWVLEEGA